MVHKSKGKHLRHLLCGNIQYCNGVIFLQAHPRQLRIIGHRDVLRFQRLYKALRSRSTHSRRHQFRRIKMVKTGHREFSIFPQFGIRFRNRQYRNTAFRILGKILTRRTFAGHQQILAIGRKLNHVRLTTDLVQAQYFEAIGITHHLDLTIAPFFVFEHTHGNQVPVNRHARRISRNFGFRHLLGKPRIFQVNNFNNLRIAHDKQFLLGRHISRYLGRFHRNCRKRLEHTPPLERSCRHRILRKTKARKQKQASTQHQLIHPHLNVSVTS